MGEAGSRATNYLGLHLANPFLVLDLSPNASVEMVERKGELLISMLTVGMTEATSYQTPFGPRERTSELVREALAELRDPNRRLVHEWRLQEMEP